MKRRYADGGKLPSAEEAVRTAVVEPVPQIKPEPKRKPKEPARPERPFRAEMLQKFGGKMKEPPMPDEGPTENKAKGGKVGSASKRADGIAARGKTRGKMV